MITRELLKEVFPDPRDVAEIAELVPSEGMSPLQFAAVQLPARSRVAVLLRRDVLGKQFGPAVAAIAERYLAKLAAPGITKDRLIALAGQLSSRDARYFANRAVMWADDDAARAAEDAGASWTEQRAAARAARKAEHEAQLADIIRALGGT